MKWVNFLFWVNAVGAFFAFFCFSVSTRIPFLAASSPYYAIGGVGFGVGMIANYLQLPKEKSKLK